MHSTFFRPDHRGRVERRQTDARAHVQDDVVRLDAVAQPAAPCAARSGRASAHAASSVRSAARPPARAARAARSATVSQPCATIFARYERSASPIRRAVRRRRARAFRPLRGARGTRTRPAPPGACRGLRDPDVVVHIGFELRLHLGQHVLRHREVHRDVVSRPDGALGADGAVGAASHQKALLLDGAHEIIGRMPGGSPTTSVPSMSN